MTGPLSLDRNSEANFKSTVSSYSEGKSEPCILHLDNWVGLGALAPSLAGLTVDFLKYRAKLGSTVALPRNITRPVQRKQLLLQ